MDAPQQTAEWLAERAGYCTASRFADVLAKIKAGEASTRRKYRLQLVTERLTGLPCGSSYTNAAMQWGTEQEPFARMAYEARHGVIVMEAPFRKHLTVPWVGASPDGEVDHDGLTEIKCPDSTTHVEWLQSGIAPTEHFAQMQGQMWVTDRQWCDFVSFDPRMPERLRLFVIRVPRNQEYIDKLAAEVSTFLREVDETIAALERLAA